MLAAPAPSAPTIFWQDVPCPLCGGEKALRFVAATDPLGEPGTLFQVVRCQACGLCYTNPRPDPASIGFFYPADYGPHHRKQARRLTLPFLSRRESDRRTLPWHGEGRLLDYGCGRGAFLDRMARRGWQVLGIDFSETAVASVRENYNLPPLLGTLPHPALGPSSLDVVTMWHVLEHLPDPLHTLRHAREVLAPAGKLCVEVPALDSWAYRVFGPDWFGLELPRHLTHFTSDTLRAMLE